MDIQNTINHICFSMHNLPQLSIGELILKLEAINDKNKKVIIDFTKKPPLGIGSWAGIYHSEAAISYSIQYEGQEFKPMSVNDFLAMLNEAINGKVFWGDNGYEFLFDKDTPLWVADQGCSRVDNYKGLYSPHVVVVGVNDGEIVILETDICET